MEKNKKEKLFLVNEERNEEEQTILSSYQGDLLLLLHQKGKYNKKMSSSYSNYTNSPCAACKFLRRKCTSDCVFAPYFPPEEPKKFANVHRIFGASNVSKILQEVEPHQREDAVNSLAYEAEARLRDPVYGCVGAISVLQRQVLGLQRELEETNADIMRYASCLGGETTSVYGARRG
ncbi:hypothetical protein Bca101_077748 [Brassica carinata]